MANPYSCKHYACKPGMKFECARGVPIRTHVGGAEHGWMARMPCVTTSLSRDQVPCELREYPTPEELAESERRMREAMDSVLAGRSSCCHAPLIARGTARYCSKCREFVARLCGESEARNG